MYKTLMVCVPFTTQKQRCHTNGRKPDNRYWFGGKQNPLYFWKGIQNIGGSVTMWAGISVKSHIEQYFVVLYAQIVGTHITYANHKAYQQNYMYWFLWLITGAISGVSSHQYMYYIC